MVEKQELQDLLKNLYIISGFRMSLFDVHHKGICSYPKTSEFCNLIHNNAEACALCIKCDQEGIQQVTKTGNMYLYQCHLGLYEAIFPLYYGERLTGFLMMGQSLSTSKFDKDNVFEKSKAFITDEKKLRAAIDQLNTYTIEKLNACAAIIEICASYLTLTKQLKYPAPNLSVAVKEYIENFYDLPIQLEDLESHFQCSKATITHSFRNNYNISIHQYLIQYRLEQSILLLEQINLTIKEIAFKCGFQDSNYFSKVFVKKYKKSPTLYRAELLKTHRIND